MLKQVPMGSLITDSSKTGLGNPANRDLKACKDTQPQSASPNARKGGQSGTEKFQIAEVAGKSSKAFFSYTVKWSYSCQKTGKECKIEEEFKYEVQKS